jgi:serine/threonine-protein kinase
MQADLYSVGLLALEMLRGEPLASEQVSQDGLLELKMALPERLPDLLPPAVVANDALLTLLQDLLEPDPQKRLVSAREADTGHQRLAQIDAQLVRAGLGSEYARDLSEYLGKLVDEKTDRVEAGQSDAEAPSTRVT